MGYLNSTTVTIDEILTTKGRQLLAANDGSFRITQFALSDDEIDYTLYNPNHPMFNVKKMGEVGQKLLRNLL